MNGPRSGCSKPAGSIMPVNLGLGYRISRDGSAVALDWEQPDGSAVTTFLLLEDVPVAVGMLLAASVEGSGRISGPSPHAALEQVMQPTDIQLVAPDDGSDWVLRVRFGRNSLDFEIAAVH